MDDSASEVPAFAGLVDLASERLGGEALLASDEFFAPKESLLKPGRGVFVPEKYTDRGKWMDGWETRRRRGPGHDWCIVRLGLPGIVRGVDVDTNHFLGNQPTHASLDACEAVRETPAEALGSRASWTEIVPRSPLGPGQRNLLAATGERRATHVRLNIYPDGGVARLRVHGVVLPDWSRFAEGDVVDLAALENGGTVVASSDMFFGAASNLLLPGAARNMGEGWETKRRRGPGFDWVVVRLGARGCVRRIEVDTSYFKGNHPDRCSVEGTDVQDRAIDARSVSEVRWREILPETKLEADTVHVFEREERAAVTHVRLSIYPDGGVARFRVFGDRAETGSGLVCRPDPVSDPLSSLNRLEPQAAREAFLRCCGSRRWAQAMVERRPFADPPTLLRAAEEVADALVAEDWLEAFAAHPRIGDLAALRERFGRAGAWSRREQAGIAAAPEAVLEEIARANRAYEERFGRIFVVCATGKGPEAILEMLRDRLRNDPEVELRIAAREQRAITRLRLEKLWSEAPRVRRPR
jgi:allantoicase